MREIHRRVTLDAPVERVWEAVTSPDHLEAWFGAQVEVDARPGARIAVRWPDGSASRGLVEVIEAPRRFAFRWRRIAGAGLSLEVGEPTRVEFVLQPLDEGARTLVTLTERDAPTPGALTPLLQERA
jgi:uncharacterized protein YndB with AHSA1/START domain